MEKQINLHSALEKIAGLQQLAESIERGEDEYTWKYLFKLAILEASSTLKEYDRIEKANQGKGKE